MLFRSRGHVTTVHGSKRLRFRQRVRRKRLPLGTLMPTSRPVYRNIPKASKGLRPRLNLDPREAYDEEVALGFGKCSSVGERLSPPWYDQRPAKYGEGRHVTKNGGRLGTDFRRGCILYWNLKCGMPYMVTQQFSFPKFVQTPTLILVPGDGHLFV